MPDGFEAWEAEQLGVAPKPTKRRFWTSIVGALLATMAVVSLLLIHVWSRYRVVHLGYEVSTLSREREDLLEEQRRLRIEYQILTRTDRIEPVARRQLGLIAPRVDQILFVPASKLSRPTLSTDATGLGEPPSRIDVAELRP